jgi:hypothetical protein
VRRFADLLTARERIGSWYATCPRWQWHTPAACIRCATRNYLIAPFCWQKPSGSRRWSSATSSASTACRGLRYGQPSIRHGISEADLPAQERSQWGPPRMNSNEGRGSGGHRRAELIRPPPVARRLECGAGSLPDAGADRQKRRRAICLCECAGARAITSATGASS